MQTSEHKEMLELIPWYVNGTLSEDECALVERHMRACLPCRTALATERRLQDLIHDQAATVPGPEHSFARLLSRIDRGRALVQPQRGRRALVYSALAACLVLISALYIWRPFPITADSTNVGFSTLSDSADTSGNRIDIIFNENVRTAEIQSFIDSIGGTLVAGPSELGRYTVSLPGSRVNELPELLTELEADPRVRFVGRNFITESPEEP